jgi:5'-nucleotidase
MLFTETGIHTDAPVALIDLGDTLCECTQALQAEMARLSHPLAPANHELVDLRPSNLEERRRLVMSAPGFWRELAPRKAGFELLRLLRGQGFDIVVLTKGPIDALHVWAEKVAWCRAHLPGVQVIVTDDKARVYGHVLVDDWLPYVERWQRAWPAGLAILPAQPWNDSITHRHDRIRYDGTNGDAVVAALRRIVYRSRE